MSQIVEDYTPITAGDTLQPFAPVIQQKDKDGNMVPFPLTGLTLTMKMVNDTDPSTVKVCAGTWTVDNAAAGLCHYDYADTDVDTPGSWRLVIILTNQANRRVHGTTKLLHILPAP